MTEPDIGNIADALRWLSSRYPSIMGGLEIDEPPDGELNRIRREIFELYLEIASNKGHPPAHGLEAFAKMTFDFIRLQSRFMRTGHYGRSSAEEIYDNFYSNKSYMDERYLDGLFLSYAFWPNHVKMIEKYRNSFLPRLDGNARVMEIGVGPGLMASDLCVRHPGVFYQAVDISSASSSWAEDVMKLRGISPERFGFIEADACAASFPIEANAFDAGICCEVLEHVEHPDRLLSNLRSALKPGSSVFLSTVANVEADDHIFLFRDRQHIRSFISEAGFEVQEELVMPLKGMESADPQPLVYAAIATTAG